MWKQQEGTEQNPRTLKDIRLGVGSEFFECPMTHKAYTYDPATGTVKCPTHDTY
jgi:hypothetical protein